MPHNQLEKNKIEEAKTFLSNWETEKEVIKEPRSAKENWEFLGRDTGPGTWKKGEVGEKIYPMPESVYDTFHRNLFKTPTIDPLKEGLNLYPYTMSEDPLIRRENLLTWSKNHKGKLILADELRNTTTYQNGVTYRDPITFYHGTTWNKEDHFDLTKSQKKEYGHWGSGNYFVTEIGDAVPYPTSRNDEMKEVIPTDLQKVRQKGIEHKSQVLQVHLAPKKPLKTTRYNIDTVHIEDPKDYDKVLEATRKLIQKNSKKKRGERDMTLESFDRKIKTSVEQAFDLGNVSDRYNMSSPALGDPVGSMFGEPELQKRESKTKSPEYIGQLDVEELSEYIPSQDFSEIAKSAGYTATLIKYKEEFLEDRFPTDTDPDHFYEVILYNTG